MKKGAISSEMILFGLFLALAIALGLVLYLYVTGQGANFIELLGSLGSEITEGISSWFTPKLLI